MRQVVVLDTNCLVQSLPRMSAYHKIWTDFMSGRYVLCVSNAILNEYQEIIERYSSPLVAQNVVAAIENSPFTVHCNSYFMFNLIEADPDDNKFVDCAISSNADFIVSEDAHFNVLQRTPFPKVRVISLNEFMTML